MQPNDIPIPEEWPGLIRKALLHAVSLARITMAAVHSGIHAGDSWDVRMASEMQQRDDEIAMLREQPTSREVTDAVEAAIVRAGKTPKYIISDKGTQFFAVNASPENREQHHYAQWCKSRRIKPRFGAVGKYGSIAIIERFMRTLKDECTRKILVPYGFDHMCDELGAFITWYNEYRPNMALDARTPAETRWTSTRVDGPRRNEVKERKNL